MEPLTEKKEEPFVWGEEIILPFPFWQINHDPILQEAVTNRAYIMFLTRRSQLRWKDFYPAPKRIFLWVLKIILIGASLLLALPTFGVSLLLLLSLPAIKHLFHGQEIIRSYPISVKQAVSIEGYHKQALIDLWSAGITGSEIVYAVYLETQERCRWSVFWFISLCSIPPILAFLLPFPPLKIFTLDLAYGYFCFELFFYRYDRAATKLACEDICELMRSWRKDSLSIPSNTRMLISTGVRWACWSGFVVAQTTLLSYSSSERSIMGLFLSSFFFFLAALILKSIQQPIQYSLEGDFEDILRTEANLSFAVFMTGTVLHDIDGVSWAKWFYHPQRELRQDEEVPNS
jgi:hypothetical protein